MSDTETLNNLLDDIVDGNDEQAQVVFHDYLRTKMSNIVNPKSDTDDFDDDNPGE